MVAINSKIQKQKAQKDRKKSFQRPSDSAQRKKKYTNPLMQEIKEEESFIQDSKLDHSNNSSKEGKKKRECQSVIAVGENNFDGDSAWDEC